MFCFFGPQPHGILAPPPGTDPSAPALIGGVLTTGPPGKSLIQCRLIFSFSLPKGAFQILLFPITNPFAPVQFYYRYTGY